MSVNELESYVLPIGMCCLIKKFNNILRNEGTTWKNPQVTNTKVHISGKLYLKSKLD